MRPGSTTAKVAVGTSGWMYDDWAQAIYAGVPRARWLIAYAQRFPVVEVNASFYRMPSAAAIAAWRERPPPGFRFVLKGSRLITHARRLVDCEAAVERLLDRVLALGPDRLAAMLWQLPPDLERDAERLDRFLAMLPAPPVHAVEFRHRSWWHDEVAEVLRRHRASQVAVSTPALPSAAPDTGPVRYVRFHGLSGGWRHDYSAGELAPWVRWLRAGADAGIPGFAFFNNDGDARAPRNAAAMISALGGAAQPWDPPPPEPGRRTATGAATRMGAG